MVTEDLFQSAREQAATRAIQRLVKGRAPSAVPPSLISPGTKILYFYRSSKASEPVEWRAGTVIRAEAHRVYIFNLSGAKSYVAYENLRLRLNSPLARELMEDTLEQVFDASIDGSMPPTDQDGIISENDDIDAPCNTQGADDDSDGQDGELSPQDVLFEEDSEDDVGLHAQDHTASVADPDHSSFSWSV